MAREDWERWTSRAAPSSTSTPRPARSSWRFVLRPRKDYARRAILPHNVPFTLLGAGLLWFGWFGFNGGSALAANPIATLAFVNTMLAPIATLVVWTLLDLARTGRATAVGAATSIVVGLVAVTPAAGFVSPISAILLGGVAAVPSYYALLWRAGTRVDDSLDVVAAHGVGGTVGALAHRRPRSEVLERRRGRSPLRQPPSARHPGGRRARDDRLQRRGHVRDRQAARRSSGRSARARATRGSAWTSRSTARRRTRAARARSSCSPMRDRPAAFPRPRPRSPRPERGSA